MQQVNNQHKQKVLACSDAESSQTQQCHRSGMQ